MKQKIKTIKKVEEPLKRLVSLCKKVKNLKEPYENLAEEIEDLSYELCENGKSEEAIGELISLAKFFETIEQKNEEQCRDLADIYLLIGQLYQFGEKFEESIIWFSKAAVVDDRYYAPYHSMAISYYRLNDIENAIKCLEQEILLSPGNYYSYLFLVDLYEKEKRQKEAELCLKALLERDPDNIQALHRIIRYYEQNDKSIDTSLLRRRILSISKPFNRIEKIIRCYYLYKEGRIEEALDFLERWNRETGGGEGIVLLMKSYLYGLVRQYSKRKAFLKEFLILTHGRKDVISSKLNEFTSVFGEDATKSLQKIAPVLILK